MDQREEGDGPLTSEYVGGSEEVLIPPAEPTGGSNSRALKIAGLTTLACLLVCSQVFSFYMVFHQRQQIHSLQRTAERLRFEWRHPKRVKFPMKFPINSMPLFADVNQQTELKATETPLTKLQDTTIVSVEKQLMDLLQDAKLPQFNETFLANMESLKRQMNETEWKSFESWMRFWLIFQMAQENPVRAASEPTSSHRTRSKCLMELEKEEGKIGSFRPQCDQQGRYRPMQCWASTGQCWCVDEAGAPIEGTIMRGIPDC